MSKNQMVFVKDYGNASIELLKIVAIIVVMLFVFLGVQKGWESVSGIFSKSKVELKEDNKKLNGTVDSLLKQDAIKNIVEENSDDLTKIDEVAAKKQKDQETKNDFLTKTNKDKAKVKITEIEKSDSTDKEQKATQSSAVIYDMVFDAFCLADPTQCKKV